MTTSFASARYMILSSVGFALMGACVKVAGEHGIPVLEIIAARALVSLVLSFIDIKRKGLSVLGNNKVLLLARGVVGTLTLICVYYALLNMPFAEATVIQYLNPLFVALLAAVFLHEPLQKVTLIAIGLSLLGLVFVVQPEIIFGQGTQALPIGASLIALLGAIGSGFAYVLVRKLSESDDPSVIILYFPLVALPLSLVLLGDKFVMPVGISWLVLLMVGIFTQLGQWGLTKAIKLAPAGKAMSFSYMQVVFAFLLGVFYFSEVPNLLALSGIVVIMFATMLSIWR